MKKCPICGERFADTYKRCPFCEEEENPRRARQPKRYSGGGRRLQHREYEEEVPRPLYEGDEEEYRPRRSAAEEEPPRRRTRQEEDDYDGEGPRRRAGEDDYDDDDYDYYDEGGGSPWFKIIMVVLIAIIIACLLYLGRGFIGNLFGGGDPDDHTPPSSMNSGDEGPDGPTVPDPSLTDPDGGTEPDVDDPDDTDPSGSGSTADPSGTSGGSGATNPSGTSGSGTGTNGTNGGGTAPSNPPPASSGLTLSHVDVSIDGGETFTLSARSGSGDVTYASKNTAVATVDGSGKVTGVAKGTTTVTVTRGGVTASCIVRVRNNGTQSEGGGPEETAAPSGGSYKLNRDDFTLAAGEDFTLKLQGVTTELTWSVKDPSVATVDGSGKVVGVAKGVTTVTASWDGGKAECIVRVK